jgi:succinyl-diaminopimelate desuccinylase
MSEHHIDGMDAVALLQALIRCPSVTPHEGGALDLLQSILSRAGFTWYRLPFGGDDGTARVDNLYARIGGATPHLCFAGHTDVVPAGDEARWTHPPFAGAIADGQIWGRGAADMKGPLACFIAATLMHLATAPLAGSISFLITGDEEGPALNGTRRVLEWLDSHGVKIDFCLVGEPTSRAAVGDMIKIGRRGSMSCKLTVRGRQGHVAYPDRADNPLPRLLTLLNALQSLRLDEGSAHFQPSNLEITGIDTGNAADNVIPAACRAAFNIRFNDNHSGESLGRLIGETLAATGVDPASYQLDIRVSGESFYTEPGEDVRLLCDAITAVTGLTPELSTSGGTSDARFIRRLAPVIEFGIVGETIHQVDERVTGPDMATLEDIYRRFIASWFAARK